MSFPDDPCAACPRIARGLPMPCRAMTKGHARYCELAAEGHAGYVALLCDEPPPPTFPTLREQAAHLLSDLGKFVASGGERAAPEEKARRMEICRSNECGQFVEGRCRRCGCTLTYRTSMAALHCPLEPPKW